MKYKGKEMTPFLFEVGKIVETKSGELSQKGGLYGIPPRNRSEVLQ